MIAVQGYDAEVERRIQAALARAGESGDAPPRFPVLRALGTLHLLRAEFPRSREVSDELAPRSRPGLEDPGLLADAHQLAGITEMNRDVQRSLEHFDASIGYFEQSPPARVQFRVGPEPGVVSHVISGSCCCGRWDSRTAPTDASRGRWSLAGEAEELPLHPRVRPLPCLAAVALAPSLCPRAARRRRSCSAWRPRTAIPSGRPWVRVLDGRLDHRGGLARPRPDRGGPRLRASPGNLDTPPVFWAHLHAIRASACLMAGRHDEADRYVEEGTSALWEGDPTEVDLAILRAELLLARPDPEPGAAAAAFERAVALADERGTRMSHLQALTRLAVLHRGTADESTAYARLREALDGFTEGRESPLLREASEVLEAGEQGTGAAPGDPGQPVARRNPRP